MSEACQDLLRGLLTLNPTKRLGCLKGGWDDVRAHAWFANMDWDAMRARSIRAPITPDPDAANCNNSADLADQLMDKEPEGTKLTEAHRRVAQNNTYRIGVLF